MNVLNTLTLLRILFAIVVFTLIGFGRYDLALLFFLLAVASDALDAWWVRRYKRISVFGRIVSPFSDKLLVCGVFVCLITIPELTSDRAGFPAWLMLQAWMVIIIIGRELLVSSLRAFVEGAGGDFSSKWLGRLRMMVQCAAIVFALLYLSGGAEWDIASFDGEERLVQEFYSAEFAAQRTTSLAQGLDSALGTKTWRTGVFYAMLVSLWLTFGITVLSALDYSIHAARMIRKQQERLEELRAAYEPRT